jgi:hypothetical protein
MATGTAITYKTGESARELRTVIVADAKRSVVLLPSGRLEILSARMLHGTACAHRFWAEQFGLDADDNTFAVPTEQVVQIRTMTNLKISKRKH